MKLNFTRVDGPMEISLPTRATEFSCGYDLYCPTYFGVGPGKQELVPLGIQWKPETWSASFASTRSRDSRNIFLDVVMGGFFAKIFDKSGLALKKRFNTRAGVIDMDYPDPWGLICVNEGDEWIHFSAGDKVAQFVLIPFLVADDLETRDSKREGGFGSTGV